MCLSRLKDKQKVIAHAKKATLQKKPCRVGYKIVRKQKLPKAKQWNLSTTFFLPPPTKLKSGWNKKQTDSPHHLVAANGPSIRTYTTGCHLYTDRAKALEYLKYLNCKKLHWNQTQTFREAARSVHSLRDMDFQIILIPVYFYEEDILATGAQQEKVCGLIDAVVVEKYYIAPKIYNQVARSTYKKVIFS